MDAARGRRALRPGRVPFLLTLVMSLTTSAASAAPPQGDWGGERAMVTFAAQGATLYEDCAESRFGPVMPDAQGRFSATGQVIAHQPGPQREEVPAGAGRPARFDGVIQDGLLRLTITSQSEPPRTLTLKAGQRAKTMRCY